VPRSNLRNAQNRWRFIRGGRQDRAAIVATIECALQAEAMPGLIVWNAFGSVELGQSSFDFGQEHEPLNGVVEGSIWRHCLERLDYAIAGKWLLHGSIVMHISPQGRSITQHDAKVPEVSRAAASRFENRLPQARSIGRSSQR